MTSTSPSREARDMTPAQREHRAVVISSFDLPGGRELLLHGCEDCACSVSDNQSLGIAELPSAADGTGHWVAGREVIEIPLDSGHRLLFNPVGRGGVVVVNDDAHR